MNAIETMTVEHKSQTFRIRIYPDCDAPNPLEDWSEMGTLLSLNRRHANYHPASIDDLLDNNPDAVPLSYYEHGLCLWSVAGELPAGANCPFDSVGIAGILASRLRNAESAKNYGGWTRRQFMRKRARQACDAYTQWCNGDVYGYDVENISVCPHCGEQTSEAIDSCWGFYGLDNCRNEAQSAIREGGQP